MAVVFSNNATTALASSVTSSATSITVQDGSVFPTLSGSDYTYITLEDLSGNVEIVKLTARSGNSLTITRAQDATTARSFSAGDKCELRLTAALLNEVASQADTDTNTTYTAGTGITLTGTTFSLTDDDADTVDGLHASSFLRSDTSDTAFGSITFTAEQKFGASYSDPDSGVQRDAKFGTNGIAVSGGIKTDSLTTSGNISFGDNDKAVFGASSDLQIYHDGSNSFITDVGTGNLNIRASNILRLQSATEEKYLEATANGSVKLYHNNNTKLATTSSGIDVTGVITTDGMTTSADINFGDNDKAVFGASSDLQIYHDGGNSYVSDQGQGELRLRGSSYVKITDTNDEVGLQFRSNGAVTLYHNNVDKFETTSSGIDVTGSVVADGLTVDGNAQVSNIGVGGAPNAHGIYVYHTDNYEAAKFQTNLSGSLARFTDTTASIEIGVQGGKPVIRTGSAARLTVDGANVQINSGSLQMGSTTVIDSSRNLTNIGTLNGGTAWRSNNDGSGSGLDADTLDGQHGSYYFSDSNKPAVADITGLIEGTSFSGTYPIVFNIGGANRLFSENNITYTGATNTLNIDGNTAWHAGNDGSGSGLDADTVDGIQASSFLRSDVNDTKSGNLVLQTSGAVTNSTTGLLFEVGGTYNDGRYRTRFRKQDVGGGIPLYIDQSSGTANSYTAQARFGTYSGNNYEFEVYGDINATGNIYDGGNAVWHAGNDGSGSGLDADTVDGQHESTFMRRSANSQLDMNNNDIVGVDQIVHEGDTDTYMQFHADNQWRVVAGGTERLEVNGGNVTVNANLFVSDQMRIGDDAWIEDFNNANAIRIKGAQSSSQGYIAFGNRSELLGQNNSGTLTFNGNTVWHQGNDGSGSGLDADTVDGIQASAFLRSDTNDTTTGSLTISGSQTRGTYPSSSQYHTGADNLVLKGDAYGISSIFFESEKNGTNINHPSDFGFIQFHSYGTGTSGESNELIIGVSNDSDDHVILNAPNANGLKYRIGASATDYTVWHSGNDGSGTGLDADTVDGIQGSNLAQTNVSSETFDGGTSTTINIKCNDGGMAMLRANGDGQGTGALEVGQSNSYGGGISYNGDGSPSFVSGETADHITFYRLDNGTRTEVFYYPYSSNTVNFNSTPTVGSSTVWHAGNDGSGSGLDADTVDGVHESTFMRRSANSQLDMNNNDIIGVDQIIHEGDSDTYMQFHAADQWRVVTGGTERFEVNNSNVTVNKQLLLTAGTDAKLLASGQYGHTFMTFRNNTDTSSYGLIYHSGSSMVYGTSSDYRLKENVVPLEGASEKLKLIPVKSFNFIEDPNRTVDGFLAHELQEHIPEAVVGEKDGIDEDGNPEYQAVDQSKLTPLLTAALQEALAKIEELEQRIENLENN